MGRARLTEEATTPLVTAGIMQEEGGARTKEAIIRTVSAAGATENTSSFSRLMADQFKLRGE